ncbi:hypothetical protein [Rufibacter tibetensis]|uniref:Uncharacterized protein n=1 Tax=Rufibacter tibetensis TaxID=512763 RepID=A0A0P0D0B1_9BACT|nr:hypothetical protein [Rufibacter tibetensis]ALJ00252.1 hypothetical protein DC20_16340 [Rufibacter tibetensis]
MKPSAEANQALASYPIKLYKQGINQESHLYNGPEYVDYRRPARDGHQFFIQDEKSLGKVYYDGAHYEEVPMLYDMVTDEVVIVVNGFLLQKLVNEKVTSFELRGHTFVRHVAQDSSNENALKTGFYDVFKAGNTNLLVKRIKLKERVIEDNKDVERYSPQDKFFLQSGNTYKEVKSKSSVYKVFNDKRRELKRYARAQKLNFRKQREASILALVLHYETLK